MNLARDHGHDEDSSVADESEQADDPNATASRPPAHQVLARVERAWKRVELRESCTSISHVMIVTVTKQGA